MLKQKLVTNYNQKKSLFLILVFFTIAIHGVVSYSIYAKCENILYKNIDKRLKDAASTIDFLLPNNFHNKTNNESSITKEEDNKNLDILSDYAQNIGIKYLYTMIKRDDKVYFTSSSATIEDISNNMVSNYFDLYKSASLELLNAFDNDEIVYEESTDEWGTFRSVFIPMESSNGNRYILGADIEITTIKKELNSVLVNSTILLIIVLFLILTVFVIKNRIELKELQFIQNVENELQKQITLKTKELNELNDNLEQRVYEEVEKNKEHERLIIKNSKLAALGEMIDAIAHQWRQPLSIIKLQNNKTLLQIECNKFSEEKIIKTLNASNKQIDHLNETLNHFRSFFRPIVKKEKIDISIAIEEVLTLMQDVIMKEKVDIKIKGDSFKFSTLKTEFEHIFINLINNSIDAFNENNIKNRKIGISLNEIDNKVEIIVKDNAGGIPEKILPQIFNVNFTTKEKGKGTGVGLYLVKQIVEKLDGEISVLNSAEGLKRGAEFRIVLNKN